MLLHALRLLLVLFVVVASLETSLAQEEPTPVPGVHDPNVVTVDLADAPRRLLLKRGARLSFGDGRGIADSRRGQTVVLRIGNRERARAPVTDDWELAWNSKEEHVSRYVSLSLAQLSPGKPDLTLCRVAVELYDESPCILAQPLPDTEVDDAIKLKVVSGIVDTTLEYRAVIDGVLRPTKFSNGEASFSTLGLEPGTHVIQVQATLGDNSGKVLTQAVPIKVRPKLILPPPDRGEINLSKLEPDVVRFTPQILASLDVREIELRLGDEKVAQSASAPFSLDVPAHRLPPGVHVLSARLTTLNGVVYHAPDIFVTVVRNVKNDIKHWQSDVANAEASVTALEARQEQQLNDFRAGRVRNAVLVESCKALAREHQATAAALEKLPLPPVFSTPDKSQVEEAHRALIASHRLLGQCWSVEARHWQTIFAREPVAVVTARLSLRAASGEPLGVDGKNAARLRTQYLTTTERIFKVCFGE